MTRGFTARLTGLAALVLSSSSSCVYYAGGDTSTRRSARSEREAPLSAALEAGSSFSAQTRDGSITIR